MRLKPPKRKTFADIDAARKRYNPKTEGYGNSEEWQDAFNERMGFAEAQRIINQHGKTPRQILGVRLVATWAEVKTAYKKLVLAVHPDRAIGDTAKARANDALKAINAAYAVLAKEYGV